jgi:hypothetical protein
MVRISIDRPSDDGALHSSPIGHSPQAPGLFARVLLPSSEPEAGKYQKMCMAKENSARQAKIGADLLTVENEKVLWHSTLAFVKACATGRSLTRCCCILHRATECSARRTEHAKAAGSSRWSSTSTQATHGADVPAIWSLSCFGLSTVHVCVGHQTGMVDGEGRPAGSSGI